MGIWLVIFIYRVTKKFFSLYFTYIKIIPNYKKIVEEKGNNLFSISIIILIKLTLQFDINSPENNFFQSVKQFQIHKN